MNSFHLGLNPHYACKAYIIALLFLSVPNVSPASEKPSNEKAISIEYLAPIDESRDINTVNLDFNYLLTRVHKVNLSLYVSLTATYATGSITQLEGSLEAGTFKEVHYDNSAFGLGPGILANFRLWKIKRFSINLYGSGSFIIYNEAFPAGGDHYNFMWRVGPSLGYAINDSRTISLTYSWAHVSNGQGVAPKNPSYEAEGPSIRLSGYF